MEPKYTDSQRKAALVCVILIALMYICSLIFALLKFDWARNMAKISIGCTLVLPILTWCYIWMFGKLSHKHTIADFDFFGIPTDHEPVTINPKEESEEGVDEETEAQ